jgi:hypothetical protein
VALSVEGLAGLEAMACMLTQKQYNIIELKTNKIQ